TEQNANVGIVGAHAAQTAARLAVEGDFSQAQMNALVTQKLVERHAGQRGDGEEIYGAYIANVAPMQVEIKKAQKKKQRRKNISDRTASLFYRMKATTSRNFAAAF
ncbi:hypothetical protein, partial [Salmonella sp. s51884]|uniref:hypothetical protein n=1 Tax=Salmonella sp. s51884 TaxID=3159654 RepID=UPI0039815DAF